MKPPFGIIFFEHFPNIEESKIRTRDVAAHPRIYNINMQIQEDKAGAWLMTCVKRTIPVS